MCHRNREQVASNVAPIVLGFVIEICPMEVEIGIGPLHVRTGIGKINSIIGVHGNENLNEAEYASENTFVTILLDLLDSLTSRNTTALELHMNDGHTVDKEHDVTTPVGKHLRFCRKMRLLRDLVTTLTAGNLSAVVNLQADLFAVMKVVIGVVSGHGNRLAVYKRIEGIRGAVGPNLLEDLSHLAICKGTPV